jgi:DNA-binding transcriptional LysR family regulator
MLPDLDSLALFVQAAEMGNLTRAAEACHITAPAASRRLALLEHQFKTQLFERHSRGLQPTPAGDRLLVMARDLISGVHQMRAEMANYASGQLAVLRVHGNNSAMTQFLPADIARFQTQHAEGVRITLEECWSEEAVRRVRSGEADLGVVVEGCDVSGLWCQPYRSDRLAAVLRADDPLDGPDMTFADLLERDLVGLEGGSSLTRLITAQATHEMRPMALREQRVCDCGGPVAGIAARDSATRCFPCAFFRGYHGAERVAHRSTAGTHTGGLPLGDAWKVSGLTSVRPIACLASLLHELETV